jgi:hypothetical protein
MYPNTNKNKIFTSLARAEAPTRRPSDPHQVVGTLALF